MRLRWTILAPALLAAAPLGDRVVEGDGLFASSVNRVPVRLRLDPGAPAIPLLAPAIADQAGLEGESVLRYRIGPKQIDGHFTEARIDLGTGVTQSRVGWAPLPYAAGLDGVVGPGGVPQRVVRFVLGSALPGAHTVSLPMVEQDGPFGQWAELFARITVGNRPIRVRFDPHHPRTLATASASSLIARALGGQLTGASEQAEVAFGIQRPVRRMTLATPLVIGPLSLQEIGVRTSDSGDASSIPDRAADPNEIVVTATTAARNPALNQLALGADVLARCSEIVFDKRAKEIRLTCA